MSLYLIGADPTVYGVPNATPAQIQQASALVDAYLERPEGVAYANDYAGAPCYMLGLSPQLTFTLSGSISPGSAVVATLTGPVSPSLLGEVLIAERATRANTEALVVQAVNGSQVTFQSVGHAHASGVTLESGLVLLEERPMPSKRNVTRVSKFPLVKLLAGQGRYAYGRRSDQVAGLYNDTNLLAALQTFGGPPAWNPFDATLADISVVTGEVWVPAGLMLAYYSDVRLRYVAGYPAASIPTPIKQATANLCMALADYSDIGGNIKKIQAGGTSIERFANTIIDADTQAMLDQFKAKLLF